MSYSSHVFSQVPKAEIPRSRFDRSYGYKTTFSESYLIPILVDEVLPGDTFDVSISSFARFATPISPIMDNVYLDYFFFAVPVRLLWENWQKFNGEQLNPGDSTDFLVPQIISPSGGFQIGSLFDYMGIPTGVSNLSVSALFPRAYNLIWNEWFRDENMQDSVSVPLSDGPDSISDFKLLKRNKRHDYFTSCLPWPQKGPEVLLPLGASAPIKTGVISSTDYLGILDGNNVRRSMDTTAGNYLTIDSASPASNGDLFADLSDATASTINQLREAFQIQRLLERDARGGTRYTEILRSHFGVISPDARLQRPEFLNGFSEPMLFKPVPQTSSTDSTTPQGNLSAYAVSSTSRKGFVKSFVEHSIIIGLVSSRADLTYQQGLNRMWSRRHRFDFYWPALSHLGEQAVLNKEIYAQGNSVDEEVFGYQERWAEYRYKSSLITGKFRSSDPQSLDFWHLAQNFANKPVLNSEFIESNPPYDRVVAVPSEPDFLFDSFISMYCTRPMPLYSVPGLIDHF